MKINKAFAAYEACLNAGINMHRDFHALLARDVERLLELAHAFGYRKPRNANGSTARCFYEYVNRGRDAANRGEVKPPTKAQLAAMKRRARS